MNIRTKPLAAAVAACALLAAPAAAGAATKTINLGLGGKPPSGTPEAAAFGEFFPSKVKVHVGDTVAFKINTFGAVYFGKGKPVAIGAFDPQTPITGSKDPAGNPFWFEGQPAFAVNPFHLGPKGDGKVGKGKGIDYSGLQDGPPKPYKVKFTKPGSYKFIDGLHPDIKGRVVVVPKGRKIPGAAADKARAAKQVAKAVKEAKRLAGVDVAANTIRIGNDSRTVGFFRFFPSEITVKAGTPIAIETGARSYDIHDLAIGPMSYLEKLEVFQGSAKGFFLAGEAVYPSQPTTAPLTFDGTQNGGFVGTGVLDASGLAGLPDKSRLTITKAGVYDFFCLLHGPDMRGRITVTE